MLLGPVGPYLTLDERVSVVTEQILLLSKFVRVLPCVFREILPVFSCALHAVSDGVLSGVFAEAGVR
jgi:hypothetical protein